MSDLPELLGYLTASSPAITYRFRFETNGWAHFTINDITGALTIQSDWGNYAYCWPGQSIASNPGHNRPTHAFLARCDAAYIANKLAYDRHRTFHQRFDSERTKAGLKRAIIERRREGALTRLEARHCWAEIDQLWDVHINEFDDPDFQSAMLWEHYPEQLAKYGIGEDLHEWFVYSPSPRYEFLAERLLPFFLEGLKGKMAADG